MSRLWEAADLSMAFWLLVVGVGLTAAGRAGCGGWATEKPRMDVNMPHPKQSLPTQLVKFGVDEHGVITPILRLGKGVSIRPGLHVRALRPRWKSLFKC